MNSIKTVGILGLGKMGCPMAGHLVAKGFNVIAYDPLAEAQEKARAGGARSATSPREVAQASELVIIVVGFDSEVEEVVHAVGGEGHMSIVLQEADLALKIRLGLPMPEIPEHF